MCIETRNNISRCSHTCVINVVSLTAFVFFFFFVRNLLYKKHDRNRVVKKCRVKKVHKNTYRYILSVVVDVFGQQSYII